MTALRLRDRVTCCCYFRQSGRFPSPQPNPWKRGSQLKLAPPPSLLSTMSDKRTELMWASRATYLLTSERRLVECKCNPPNSREGAVRVEQLKKRSSHLLFQLSCDTATTCLLATPALRRCHGKRPPEAWSWDAAFHKFMYPKKKTTLSSLKNCFVCVFFVFLKMNLCCWDYACFQVVFVSATF